MMTLGLHPASALQRLVSLRWVAIASQILALGLTVGWLGMPLLLGPMVVGVLLLVAVNGYTAWRVRQRRPVNDRELFAQLCVDVLVLEWLLYFAGGSSNPFVSLLLLPLTFTAVAMAPRYVWAMAGICFGAYSLLVFFNLPLPPLPPKLLTMEEVLAETCGLDHGPGDQGFTLHILGMWLNFTLSALIVAAFLTRQAQALRQRDQQLQAYREQSLRNEQLLALGLLSAGAAHKLGTPLATLAVLARELELSQGTDSEQAEDARLIREQVERCKGILGEMVSTATADQLADQALDTWLEAVVDEWHLLRPMAQRPKLDLLTGALTPIVKPQRALALALQNLLNNAADANPRGITLALAWDDAGVTLDILDQGPGLAPERAGLLGQGFVPRQGEQGGLGIGFFLTNATVERFGGEVELLPREPGGTCTRVRLPLSAFAGAPP